MHVFKGRLYVGTDRPAELLRINPDDTWDLVVGTPRQTPEGVKRPLSGMDVGFDNPLNIHVWRMQSHNGYLFVGHAESLHSVTDRVRYVLPTIYSNCSQPQLALKPQRHGVESTR